MKIKDMTDDELRALIIESLHQDKPAHSQPHTPRLVEAVEAYFSASDTDISFLSKKMNYHGQAERDVMRLALAAEKKRQDELKPLLCHVVLWYERKVNREDGADEILIHNIANYLRHTSHLDAYEKGESPDEAVGGEKKARE